MVISYQLRSAWNIAHLLLQNEQLTPASLIVDWLYFIFGDVKALCIWSVWWVTKHKLDLNFANLLLILEFSPTVTFFSILFLEYFCLFSYFLNPCVRAYQNQLVDSFRLSANTNIMFPTNNKCWNSCLSGSSTVMPELEIWPDWHQIRQNCKCLRSQKYSLAYRLK